MAVVPAPSCQNPLVFRIAWHDGKPDRLPNRRPAFRRWTRPGPFSPLKVGDAPYSRAGFAAASGPCRICHGRAWSEDRPGVAHCADGAASEDVAASGTLSESHGTLPRVATRRGRVRVPRLRRRCAAPLEVARTGRSNVCGASTRMRSRFLILICPSRMVSLSGVEPIAAPIKVHLRRYTHFFSRSRARRWWLYRGAGRDNSVSKGQAEAPLKLRSRVRYVK